MRLNLRGKIVVVSGVTSGIGGALVPRLLDEGAIVAGVGRDAARLGALASGWGACVFPVVADLSSPEATQRACDDVLKRFDRVDVVVNNAAECVYEAPLALPMDRWRSLLEVNLFSVIEMTRRFVERMPAGGHIVNVSSSTTRFLPNERFAAYALTKGALESWHGAIRLELEARRIKTTLVLPGLVDTPIYDKVAGFEKARGKLRESVPEWLAAGDVADAIVWTLCRPSHVAVGEITLFPVGQAR